MGWDLKFIWQISLNYWVFIGLIIIMTYQTLQSFPRGKYKTVPIQPTELKILWVWNKNIHCKAYILHIVHFFLMFDKDYFFSNVIHFGYLLVIPFCRGHHCNHREKICYQHNGSSNNQIRRCVERAIVVILDRKDFIIHRLIEN